MLPQRTSLGFANTSRLLLATLVLRLVTVILVIATLSIRPTLPLWMLAWFERVSYPLLAYTLLSLLCHKQTAALLDRYPWLLSLDTLISVAIILIGGSWRSSYFGYTITSIILCTIFIGRTGTFLSTAALMAAAVIKDPASGLPSMEVFFVSDWDMRMGAALIYATAGAILAYFRILLEKLETLSRAAVEKTAMEAKTALALELHDGAKQMVTAILLRMNPLLKQQQHGQDAVTDELRWLWRGMHYLKDDLNQIMEALGKAGPADRSTCDAVTLAREEAKIAEVMTGFAWQVAADPLRISLPHEARLPLRRFVNEALMNAWKHSGATSGAITLLAAEDTIVLTVADKGRGFDHAAKTGRNTTGLNSLRHRAKEMHGDLLVETAPGKGCAVSLTLPVNSQK